MRVRKLPNATRFLTTVARRTGDTIRDALRLHTSLSRWNLEKSPAIALPTSKKRATIEAFRSLRHAFEETEGRGISWRIDH